MNTTPIQHDDPSGGGDDLFDLIADECDGAIDAAGLARLESRLADDADARRAYLRYASLHAQLATSDRALMSVGWSERLADAAASQAVDAIVEDADADDEAPHVIALPAAWWAPWRTGVSIAAAMLVITSVGLLALLMTADRPPIPDAPDPPAARPLRGNFSLKSDELRGTLESGVEIVAFPPTEVRLESGLDATLVAGSLEATVPPDASGFAVTTPSVRVVDLGTRFRTTVDAAGVTTVDVLEGVVSVQPRHRLPRFYLDFNETDGPVVNRIDGATFAIAADVPAGGAGTTRVVGPVGRALSFDNTRAAGVTLSAAGFDAAVGMTIEAVIIPRWSGAAGDYDEVFRKQNRDMKLILLAFQHDNGLTPAVPAAVRGAPCLSFGLALEGRGYEELDMPLDGADGRPTLDALRDDKPHHVAATYDAATGIKAIYIDGKPVFSHRYPVGLRIVSAGDAPAVVGNTLPAGPEPFTGVIDEFAFYDFAVSADQLAAHHAAVRAGRPYFADAPVELPGETERSIRLAAPQSMSFDALTGLPRRDAQP